MEDYRSIIRESRPELKFCEHFDDSSHIWNFSRHSHPYFELMYFMAGQGVLEVERRKMSINLYDVVIYPSHWAHQESEATEQRREIICLWVSLPELELTQPIQLHDQDGILGRLFQELHKEAKRDRPEPLILEYEMKLLFTMILRNHSESRAREDALSYVLPYIHAHYAEPITLDQLAALEHISKSYLSRQFKQQTGQTVVSYINSLRIETAKHLLAATRANVDEIADQVGFQSPTYFDRTFRAFTGDTPAGFRRRYQN